MRAAVVYESMYTNTHHVAEAVASGLRRSVETVVLPVPADDMAIDGVDLLVVGGPTHVHGMSRASTRHAAVEAADRSDADLELDPSATGPGLREWLSSLAMVDIYAAAFDTRMSGPALVTGRASKTIGKRLHYTGCTMLAEPEGFIVDKQNQLEPGELERARKWGEQLAEALAAQPPVPPYESTRATLASSEGATQ